MLVNCLVLSTNLIITTFVFLCGRKSKPQSKAQLKAQAQHNGRNLTPQLQSPDITKRNEEQMRARIDAEIEAAERASKAKEQKCRVKESVYVDGPPVVSKFVA
ncbi:hypothetical protein M3Y94_00917600 [Aphelenchoides besseyi]|nr:hypothetical protein M3Y94_00917600 [Aphelenchoides besseyi]KAI6223217.1 hypothetical protein M3Y95_00866100 [Aphelenchoides besseyi]